ncbi:MAG: taurine transporter [Hyphomicrobiales bacterium]|nr:taurine transporter [Hyphomicrobiales bacterium]
MVAVGQMNDAPRRRRLRISNSVTTYRVVALVLLFALWEIAGASGLFFRGVIPSTVLIAQAFVRLFGDPAFYTHFGITLFEIVVGFVIGSSLGVVVGLALGINRYTGEVFEPMLNYLASTPKVVFLPILLILFGIGVGSKISLGAISCFFPMALSVAAGVRTINPMFLRVGQSLNLSFGHRIRNIYIPALLPPIATGLRLGFGIATVGCLMSEIKLSNHGLGYAAMQAYNRFDIPTMLALLLIIFTLAGLGNYLIGRFVRLPGPTNRRTTVLPPR